MFFVKCMVAEDQKWNGKEWEKVGPFLTNPCGSEYSFIIRDLKTLRGVKNRLKNYPIKSNVVQLNIYSCTNVYDEKTFRLLETIKR